MHQCLLYEKPRHCEHRTIYPRKNLMCLQDIGHRTWHQKWYQKCRYPRLQSALTQPIDLILYCGVYNNAHFTSSFSPTVRHHSSSSRKHTPGPASVLFWLILAFLKGKRQILIFRPEYSLNSILIEMRGYRQNFCSKEDESNL